MFSKKLIAAAIVAISATFSSASNAELFGLGAGRSANLDNMASLSVEGGANLGGFVSLFGGRVNYKVRPDILIYGDLGRADRGSFDGFVFGVGAQYQLRGVQLLDNTDTAVMVSYHDGTLETGSGFFEFELDASELAIRGVISGDQLASTSFAWYGSAGLHILDFGTELGFGGGIIGDLSFGEFYVGAELIEEFQINVGLRYNIR